MKRQNFVGQVIKSYTFIRLLGEGAWASVYQALDDRDKNTVAIKIIAKNLMVQTPKLEELVKTQIKVLKSCKNQNVIKYVDSFTSGNSLFIVTQYCNGGDLQQYLKFKKNLSEDQATTFLKQILNGFKGLHEVKAMHRDFKVANVLLHNSVCKIADLGFAKQMENKNIAITVLGTSLTMAPEVLDSKPYGFQADIWSIGVVYYQMLYGKYPYMGMNDIDILKKIKNSRPDFSRMNISKNSEDFINRCLCVDPKKRISWIQIYSHQLLANKNENIIYGTLKQKISINENRNFYKKNQFQNNPSPNLNNLDLASVQFEKVDDIRQSQNMEAVIQEAQRKKEKQNLSRKYQKLYIQKRNDIMFIFKFVSPFVPNFNHIHANHGIAMFILSKNSYIEMKKFYSELKKQNNIFGMTKYFNEFIQSSSYLHLTKQIQSDIQIIGVQCSSYSCDIKSCSNQISSQFNVNETWSKNWNQLVKDTVQQYWFLLAEALDSVKNERKKDLIKVLQALSYYKNNKEIKAQEFDYFMTFLDFNIAQKDIIQQFQSVFQ